MNRVVRCCTAIGGPLEAVDAGLRACVDGCGDLAMRLITMMCL
jgi:hypothetical protein